LEALHDAYLSRTDALRCYQASVLQLTDELNDLRTSNAALKRQLDVTSQAHASLLTELTNPGGRISSDDGAMSPVGEDGEDSGWWSDSGIGAEEDDTMTLAPSPSMKRGSMAGDWHRRSSSPGDVGEVKLLRKENQRMREEIQRLEGVLEDCSMVLGGL
jgi:hypothetical protein